MLKMKDTDFLTASARIRALERQMVTHRDLRKMLDSSSIEEAYKVLTDLGTGAEYGWQDYELALRDELEQTFELLATLSNGSPVFEVFRLKYDGHNIKSIVKSQATETDPAPQLTRLGNVSPEALLTAFEQHSFSQLDPELAQAAVEATEVLAKTKDPQAVDVLVDRAVLCAMRRRAEEYGVAYLSGYVRAQIDISNIRTLIRLKRIGKEVDTLQKMLIEGGSIPTVRLCESLPKSYEDIFALLSSTPYGRYLEPALDDLRQDKPLTRFERLCDDYVIQLMNQSRLIPFGIEPLITYLLAKEIEVKDIRIVLASKLAGVPSEQIVERLRETYA